MSGNSQRPSGVRSLARPLIWAAGCVSSLALLLLFTGSEYPAFSLALGLLVIAAAFMFAGTHRQTLAFSWRDPALPLLLWFIWVWLSIHWSDAPAVSALTYWWYMPLLLAFTITAATPCDKKTWLLGWHAILVLGLGLAAWAAWSHLMHQVDPRGPFLNKNNFAALLSLLALPLISLLLKPRPVYRQALYAIGLFMLLYVIAVIDSRGAILALLAGLVVIFLATRHHAPYPRWSLPLAIAALAFLAAHFPGENTSGSRILTLANPGEAGATRLVLWHGASKLLFSSPWLGIGPGLFAHAYPSVRDPMDRSGGYFVHNDYLEFWIETGLPGIAFVVWCAAAMGGRFWRSIRAPSTVTDLSLERAGLFAGLTALAMHSLFTFNLHVPALLLLAGAYLGRLRQITRPPAANACFSLKPEQYLSRPIWLAFILALAIPALVQISSIGLSSYYLQQADNAAQAGNIERADTLLQQAIKITPSIGSPYLHRADLLQHVARTIPESDAEYRISLRELAEENYHQATALNPFSPKPWHGLGRLQAHHYPDAPSLAAASFARALELDPRFVPARFDYGQLLVSNGDLDGALTLLTEGLRYYYNPVVNIVPYYQLTSRLLRATGRDKEAEALESKISRIYQYQQAGDF